MLCVFKADFNGLEFKNTNYGDESTCRRHGMKQKQTSIQRDLFE